MSESKSPVSRQLEMARNIDHPYNAIHFAIAVLKAVHQEDQQGRDFSVEDVAVHLDTGGVSLIARMEAHAAIERGASHVDVARVFLDVAKAVNARTPCEGKDAYRFEELLAMFRALESKVWPLENADTDDLRSLVYEIRDASSHIAIKCLAHAIDEWLYIIRIYDVVELHHDYAFSFDDAAQDVTKGLISVGLSAMLIQGLAALKPAKAKRATKKPRRASRAKAA